MRTRVVGGHMREVCVGVGVCGCVLGWGMLECTRRLSFHVCSTTSAAYHATRLGIVHVRTRTRGHAHAHAHAAALYRVCVVFWHGCQPANRGRLRMMCWPQDGAENYISSCFALPAVSTRRTAAGGVKACHVSARAVPRPLQPSRGGGGQVNAHKHADC